MISDKSFHTLLMWNWIWVLKKVVILKCVSKCQTFLILPWPVHFENFAKKGVVIWKVCFEILVKKVSNDSWLKVLKVLNQATLSNIQQVLQSRGGKSFIITCTGPSCSLKEITKFSFEKRRWPEVDLFILFWLSLVCFDIRDELFYQRFIESIVLGRNCICGEKKPERNHFFWWFAHSSVSLSWAMY